MLLLTRKPTETICIGENVTVTIMAVKGQQIRLGIDAPRDIEVDRGEVRARKLKERA